MTLESRKLGMIIYALLAGMVLFLYKDSIPIEMAVGVLAPIGIYAFVDQAKNITNIRKSS